MFWKASAVRCAAGRSARPTARAREGESEVGLVCEHEDGACWVGVVAGEQGGIPTFEAPEIDGDGSWVEGGLDSGRTRRAA